MIRVGVALLSLSALIITGCSWLPNEEREPVPALVPPVRSERPIYPVRRGDIVETITLRARLSPEKVQEVYSPYGGRVKAILVRTGERVQPGHVLAELHAEETELQLAHAKIRCEKAEHLAREAHARWVNTPGSDWESEYRLRQLDLEGARLDLQHWEERMRATRLAAPFGGQTMAVHVKVGELISGYQPVLTLADPSSLRIEADIDEGSLLRVAAGQTAVIDFPDLGPGLTGTVVEVPELGRSAGTQPQRVVIQSDSPIEGRMGMVGRVTLPLQSRQGVLLVPRSTVRQYGGRSYVLTDNPRREVDVVTGLQTELEIEILSGLKEGDVVVGR